jgi:hypothetical protein
MTSIILISPISNIKEISKMNVLIRLKAKKMIGHCSRALCFNNFDIYPEHQP